MSIHRNSHGGHGISVGTGTRQVVGVMVLVSGVSLIGGATVVTKVVEIVVRAAVRAAVMMMVVVVGR